MKQGKEKRRMKQGTLGTLIAVTIMCGTVVAACGPVERPPIKIGVEGPMTGEWAYEGEGFRRAVLLLADEINEEGGLLDGRTVEVVVGDDRGDPEEARRVARRLIEEGVVAVVGAYNSDATEASSEVYDAAGVLQITPSSTAIRLTEKGYTRFFRTCFCDDSQGEFAAELMIRTLGKQRVALVHDNTVYAKGLAEWAQRYTEELNGEVVLFTAITPGQRDFTTLLEQLEASAAEVLYFTGYYPEGGLLVKQMKETGLTDIQFIGGDAVNNPEFVAIAGIEAASGTLVTSAALIEDLRYPETTQFVAGYEEAYGERPMSAWTLAAADGFRLIQHAIAETSSTDPAVLAEFLRTLEGFPGITGPIVGYDEKGDRQGIGIVAYIVNEEGNLVLYQP
jgi:branched-chain amino acid transport system substrate-binding protein